MTTSDTIEHRLLTFLEERTGESPAVDDDLFASGVVSSMFAMQLVVHLESAYAVAIVGKDLKLDNFRTVRSMAELVRRLWDGSSAAA